MFDEAFAGENSAEKQVCELCDDWERVREGLAAGIGKSPEEEKLYEKALNTGFDVAAKLPGLLRNWPDTVPASLSGYSPKTPCTASDAELDAARPYAMGILKESILQDDLTGEPLNPHDKLAPSVLGCSAECRLNIQIFVAQPLAPQLSRLARMHTRVERFCTRLREEMGDVLDIPLLQRALAEPNPYDLASVDDSIPTRLLDIPALAAQDRKASREPFEFDEEEFEQDEAVIQRVHFRLIRLMFDLGHRESCLLPMLYITLACAMEELQIPLQALSEKVHMQQALKDTASPRHPHSGNILQAAYEFLDSQIHSRST